MEQKTGRKRTHPPETLVRYITLFIIVLSECQTDEALLYLRRALTNKVALIIICRKIANIFICSIYYTLCYKLNDNYKLQEIMSLSHYLRSWLCIEKNFKAVWSIIAECLLTDYIMQSHINRRSVSSYGKICSIRIHSYLCFYKWPYNQLIFLFRWHQMF